MDHPTFDTFARRAAGLLDRRALVGGLSGALLTLGGIPLATEAKKGKHKHKNGNKGNKGCKNRKNACLREWLPRCDSALGRDCEDFVRDCCQKACKSVDEAERCLEGGG